MKNSNFSVFNIGFKDVEAFFSFAKIKQLYELPESLEWKEIAVLVKAAKFRRFKAKSLMIEAGDTSNNNIYFIFKGLVRGFHVNEKGDEITGLLYKENQFFFSPDVILLRQASLYNFECLESTYVGYLDFDSIQKILAENKKMDEMRRLVIHKALRRVYERTNSFILLSPEERYLAFVEKYPDLTQRVPNKYIANVLGVTPVSLSRIRSRLASKKK